MTKECLTQSKLKELLNYNPDTGIFLWEERSARHFTDGKYSSQRKANIWNSTNAWEEAGTIQSNGYSYISIKIKGTAKLYKASRLAFLYIEGAFPINQCDHINHIRDDNRWLNLRHVTQDENKRNASRRHDNTSGCTGVLWYKATKKWCAYVNINGIRKNLGYYTEIWSAICVRKSAEYKYGFHPNHGCA